MNRRYQLADRLLDMANRLLFNDQGIPLNQTFGSPFGSSYVAGSPSPYPSYTMGSNATSPFHPPMNDSTGYPPPGMPGLGSYPSSSSSQFPHSTISGPFGGPSQQLDFNNPWSRLPGSYSPPPGNGYGNGSGNPISDWMSRWFYPGWTKNARQNTLYPPITNTADLLNRTSVFPTLQSLLNRSGLTSTLANLESQGPVIVFAPTEQAFRRLQQRDPQLFQRLTDPRNSSVLMEILKYHVSQATRQGFRFPANNVAVDSLTSKDDIQFSGNAFQGRIQNGNQLVTTGRALKLPNNTLIVPIDDVLIPPSFDMSQLKQST